MADHRAVNFFTEELKHRVGETMEYELMRHCSLERPKGVAMERWINVLGEEWRYFHTEWHPGDPGPTILGRPMEEPTGTEEDQVAIDRRWRHLTYCMETACSQARALLLQEEEQWEERKEEDEEEADEDAEGREESRRDPGPAPRQGCHKGVVQVKERRRSRAAGGGAAPTFQERILANMVARCRRLRFLQQRAQDRSEEAGALRQKVEEAARRLDVAIPAGVDRWTALEKEAGERLHRCREEARRARINGWKKRLRESPRAAHAWLRGGTRGHQGHRSTARRTRQGQPRRRRRRCCCS